MKHLNININHLKTITMSRIHKITKIPQIITEYFNRKFPPSAGFTFDFYWYGTKELKYYGCYVKYNGELWSYSDQDTIEGFAKDVNNNSIEPINPLRYAD